MAASVRLVGLAEELLPVANKNVTSDIAAAAAAISAAAVTAAVNIEANLAGIKDEALRRELSATAALADGVTDRAGRVIAAVREEIAQVTTEPAGLPRARAAVSSPGSCAPAVAARAAELAARRAAQPRLAVVTANDDGGSAAYVRSIAAAAGRDGNRLRRGAHDHGGGHHRDAHPARRRPGGARDHPADAAARGREPGRPRDGRSRARRTWTARARSRSAAWSPGCPRSRPPRRRRCSRCSITTGWNCAAGTRWWWGVRSWSGKPAAHLLLDRHATVTICHSRTADLPAITRQADVLVAAVGRAGLIGPGHVSPGTTVIDVGTNADPGRRPRGRRGPGGGGRRGRAHPGARRRRPGHHGAAAQPRGAGRARYAG